jgi:hypothetical protein
LVAGLAAGGSGGAGGSGSGGGGGAGNGGGSGTGGASGTGAADTANGTAADGSVAPAAHDHDEWKWIDPLGATSPTASGRADADPTSTASGSSHARNGSVASGEAQARNGSTASGNSIAVNGSVASGCATAVNHSTASGGDCLPAHDGDKLAADIAGAEANINRVGGGQLAFTGVDVTSMAEVAAASGAFGALLVAMGSIGRRRKARP